MARSMTLNVRITGELSSHVADAVGDDGLFENVSEYVRDLIRRDYVRAERERFAALQAELHRAFAVPDEEYVSFDGDAFLARMRERHG